LTFGLVELSDGIGFVPLAMGLFAIPEIVRNLERPEERTVLTGKIQGLWPTRDDFRRSWPAVLRGTGVGSLLGILP
jgi:putative tricarboxylic transport membrane protein